MSCQAARVAAVCGGGSDLQRVPPGWTRGRPAGFPPLQAGVRAHPQAEEFPSWQRGRGWGGAMRRLTASQRPGSVCSQLVPSGSDMNRRPCSEKGLSLCPCLPSCARWLLRLLSSASGSAGGQLLSKVLDRCAVSCHRHQWSRGWQGTPVSRGGWPASRTPAQQSAGDCSFERL